MGIGQTFSAWARKIGLIDDRLIQGGEDEPAAFNIVLCNDETSLHDNAKYAIRALKRQGHSVGITCLSNQRQLMSHLVRVEEEGLPPPNAYFLDVGGVGEQAAKRVIGWHDKNGAPLPGINFLSLSEEMGIRTAGNLRLSEPRIKAGYCDEMELVWLREYMSGRPAFLIKRSYMPVATSFRETLNAALGTDIPLDHDNSRCAYLIKSMSEVSNDRLLSAMERGEATDQQVIDRMRGYALGLAKSLRDGVYGAPAGQQDELKADAHFYASAGFPVKASVALSLKDARSMYASTGEKPVLVMQSYDPDVVPLMAEGVLSGIVVTSSYMASHLKLLCETYMISGLFGIKPNGEKTLGGAFNEEARPSLPPYFDGPAKIAGHVVAAGQQVLVSHAGDGIMFNPPASMQAQFTPDIGSRDNIQLRSDLANLERINAAFDGFFKMHDVPTHGIKSNVNAPRLGIAAAAPQGIGLVRTEQLVAGDLEQLNCLRRYLLDDEGEALFAITKFMEYQYSNIIPLLDRDKPVKFRLFDFVHEEIFDKEDQKDFIDKYGRIDLHGGAALDAFYGLYGSQCRVIFETLKNASLWNNRPLEIMMPAVRTVEDVLKAKEIVDGMAKVVGVESKQYSFGVMVETLEACENIEKIAPHVDFISFGTNDLTQQRFDIGRSDLKTQARFAEKHGFDPFKILAPEVLALVEDVVQRGRAVKPALKADVCGAQAADADTAIKLFEAGVDNISVSPTLANLYALPVLLNYKAYDAHVPPQLPAQQPRGQEI